MLQKQQLLIDRIDAGKQLADLLINYKKYNPLILALPRGGVPVAYQVARRLEAPLDVFIVRKIGSPRQPEYGIGGISENGVLYLDKRTILGLGITKQEILGIIQKEETEAQRRVQLYRKGKPTLNIVNRTVILIDDGLATGVTALTAFKALTAMKPKQIIIAVPVSAQDAADLLSKKVNRFFCLLKTPDLKAISSYYQQFAQVSDKEVIEILREADQFGLI